MGYRTELARSGCTKRMQDVPKENCAWQIIVQSSSTARTDLEVSITLANDFLWEHVRSTLHYKFHK